MLVPKSSTPSGTLRTADPVALTYAVLAAASDPDVDALVLTGADAGNYTVTAPTTTASRRSTSCTSGSRWSTVRPET